jgi:hypothetical protein
MEGKRGQIGYKGAIVLMTILVAIASFSAGYTQAGKTMKEDCMEMMSYHGCVIEVNQTHETREYQGIPEGYQTNR